MTDKKSKESLRKVKFNPEHQDMIILLKEGLTADEMKKVLGWEKNQREQDPNVWVFDKGFVDEVLVVNKQKEKKNLISRYLARIKFW